MAHRIAHRHGKDAMMYVDEVPWHKLGKRLMAPPTSAEAITAAGLNWTAEKKPLFAIEGSSALSIKGRYAIVPQDMWGDPKCPIFGIVSE